MGLASLAWFLLRVIPKPSRASYPCQRAAFRVASSFVVWLTALLGSAFAFRKLRVRDQRFWKMCLWGAAALAGCALVLTSLPTLRTFADNPPHGPLGVAKGLFPGRVAWVYAPGATTWDGYTSPEHWYHSNHCDLATVELMLSKGLQSVGGASSDAAAWNAIFIYFNQNHSRGTRGYQVGEKIAIKINLTTCNARSGSSTVNINGDYEKNNAYDGHWLNSVDAAPQLLVSLLRQLVYKVGVAQADISVGDPTGNFPKYLWDRLHPEFPDVVYLDNYGQQGRTRVQLSSVPFYWSVTNANTPGLPVVMDYVPVPFAQADYLIDLAVPKSHAGAGITVCGKTSTAHCCAVRTVISVTRTDRTSPARLIIAAAREPAQLNLGPAWAGPLSCPGGSPRPSEPRRQDPPLPGRPVVLRPGLGRASLQVENGALQRQLALKPVCFPGPNSVGFGLLTISCSPNGRRSWVPAG